MRWAVFVFSIFMLFQQPLAQAQPQCTDVFVRTFHWERLSQVSVIKAQEALFQTAELKEHGFIYDLKNSNGVEKLRAFVRERDGTYPFLINKKGLLMIDHRLPLQKWDINSSFLGTHRGLFERLKAQANQSLDIIFAGEIRVVGKSIVQLSDDSIHFYRNFVNKSRQEDRWAWSQLLEQNKKKMEVLRELLILTGVLPKDVSIVLAENNSTGFDMSHRRYAYVRSLQAARFEMQCRMNPSCWNLFEHVQKHIVQIGNMGGEKFLVSQTTELLKKDPTKAVNMIQHLSLIFKEGLVDVMARENVMTEGTEPHRLFFSFVEDLPVFFPL